MNGHSAPLPFCRRINAIRTCFAAIFRAWALQYYTLPMPWLCRYRRFKRQRGSKDNAAHFQHPFAASARLPFGP